MAETVNAADPAEEKRQREEERQRARNDADVLRKVMFTKEGRDWLYRKLDACHIFGNPFSPGAADITAFNLGEQNVGKMLLAEAMDASPDQYMQMMRERREEEKRLAKVRRADAESMTPEARDAQEALGVNEHMIDLPPPEGWEA